MQERIQPSRQNIRNPKFVQSLDVNAQTCNVKLPKFNFNTLTNEVGMPLEGPDPNEDYVNYLTSIV